MSCLEFATCSWCQQRACGAHRVMKAPVPRSPSQCMCCVCHVLYSQVGTCLAVSTHGQCSGPCSVLSGYMCAVPMLYSVQGPLPSDYPQFPTHLAVCLPHVHQPSGTRAVLGSQPLCPAAWRGQAWCPHHICHQWSYGIKLRFQSHKCWKMGNDGSHGNTNSAPCPWRTAVHAQGRHGHHAAELRLSGEP